MGRVEHFRIVNPDCKLGRVVGGFAWPGERPGFASIIGEERFPRIGANIYPYHLLAEVQESDVDKLVKACLDLSKIYSVVHFYGKSQETDFLTSYNLKAREIKEPEFYFKDAPFSEDGMLEPYVNLIEKKLYEEGSLNLALGSKTRGYLWDIPENETPLISVSQYPAVAALGYAIAYLNNSEAPFKPSRYEAPGQRSEFWIKGSSF